MNFLSCKKDSNGSILLIRVKINHYFEIIYNNVHEYLEYAQVFEATFRHLTYLPDCSTISGQVTGQTICKFVYKKHWQTTKKCDILIPYMSICLLDKIPTAGPIAG